MRERFCGGWWGQLTVAIATQCVFDRHVQIHAQTYEVASLRAEMLPRFPETESDAAARVFWI